MCGRDGIRELGSDRGSGIRRRETAVWRVGRQVAEEDG